MFTGIINHFGFFKEYRNGKQEMLLEAPSVSSKIEIGESLAVNGICLSLIKKNKDILYFNLSKETLSRTNLGALKKGEKLNLELPLSLSTPLSGHIVNGHIDFTGKILKSIRKNNSMRLTISIPPEQRPYFIPKGSVALNGISLTIADLKKNSFEVEIIPITLANSNLKNIKTGETVNIECDIIGKYVYNYIRQVT
ncbi:MAG: riboflavin synthase [Candidatus Aminicenantaceae bacterium]